MPAPAQVPGVVSAGPSLFPFDSPRSIPSQQGRAGGAPLAAGANWYVRVGGANTNGGSSASLTPERNGTDAVCNSTTTVTSATAAFTSADIGKGINISTAARKIVSITSGTSIVVDRPFTVSASGLSWAIGGAWADMRIAVGDLAITDGRFPVSAGDTVWIGAGVYRNVVAVTTVTLVSTGVAANTAAAAGIQPTGEVRYIGDVDGSHTGDAGMVQLTAYLTNDKTAPSATTLLNLNGKSNLTFQNIMFVGGNAVIVTATTLTSQNITFRDCCFQPGFSQTTGIITATCGFNVSMNWIIDKCKLGATSTSNALQFTLTTGVGADYDSNVLIQNSLFVSSSSGRVIFVTNSGTLANKGGGVKVRNCLALANASSFLVTTAAQISVSVPCSVYNSVFSVFTGLSAGTLGQIVEDYNLILATTPRTNVPAGQHSVSDGSYAPLFHFGQELQWGGTLRPFGEPMQSSPLRAFGSDGSATPLDIRGGPRPSSPSQVDVGAYQRANTATQETSVVQAGSSAIKITGQGSQDFAVPVSAVATTLSIYLRYSSAYVGPLPTLQIVGATQVGVGNITLPISGASLNAYAQYSIVINPTAAGIVTVRVVSGDTSGSGIVYADVFAAT